MTKRRVLCLIIGTGLLSICSVLYAGNFLFRFWIPSPSETAIELALKSQFDAKSYGLSAPILSYDITRIDRPRGRGSSEPKMWIWLRVRDGNGGNSAGLLNIILINSEPNHLVLGPYVPVSEINSDFLSRYFTTAERRRIDQLMSQ